ncbi:hypothetical protein DMX12_26540 [Pseudomonas sp. MB-090624]|nr:hypothetical protein DMX12_26540 [Pseudomonas sp. MB-090624]
MGSDRASRRTLIALGGEPPRCGVASKVLATWVLSRTALVQFWLGKRIKWLILPLHESETDRHLIGLSG